ncbi:histidine kinase [Gracilibacillus sp. YIM 98692]|uniref:sensor histidine kinase n=1 Tax=Gracilibacillus sp. YIM 98692 TaxID=2663532 RepID=UPI0013D2A653|nr:histidine kinase [Gracilibacillus sp. YIM 98692]
MLQRLRNRQLHIKVFIVYSVILVALTSLVAIPINMYIKDNLKQTLDNETRSTAENIMTRLDIFYNQYEQISKYFYLDQDQQGITPVEYFEIWKNKPGEQAYITYNAIMNSLALNTELFESVTRISLYTNDLLYLSSKTTSNNPFKKIDYLEETRAKKGGVSVQYSSRDPWSKTSDVPVLIFNRQLHISNREVGFLEVQFNGSDLSTTSLMHGGEITVVYGDEKVNNAIYHSGQDLNEQQVNHIQDLIDSESVGVTNNMDGYLYHYLYSKESKFHVIYSMEENKIYAPVDQFNYLMIFIVFIIITLASTVFYITAKRLTNPLRNLIRVIDHISLEEKPFKLENKHQLNEIDSLNHSFHLMNTRLQHSLNKIVQFHTSESQLKLKLLQAQINPHFIFNMIGVITILSKRGNNSEVEKVSRKLANFLRYTTSMDYRQIDLMKEIEFTKNYLDLMKTRYKDRISFEINILDEMNHIPIPKVIIQPIVENSLTHGLANNQTINIRVNAEMENNKWKVLVQDDGAGFSAESMKKLDDQIAEYKNNPTNNYDLSIGGMGILSTFIRLDLFYSENVIFNYGNNPSGGAYVLIGVGLKN